MLTGIWAGVRVLSSDLKKEREEVVKGGRETRERERERQNQSHTTHHLATKDRVSVPFH